MTETQPFEAVKISEHVWWVGAVDRLVRDFHGYLTSRGSTYNAYLVKGEGRWTLIDTVKAGFVDEMMARIASVVDPTEIDTIVSNHSEMDHSGSLPETCGRISPKTIYASANGVKALTDHFRMDREITAVADGEALDLGGVHLACVETKMVHWPDSMMTFLAEDGVLFSQDGFGMHLASDERFADEISDDILTEEATKYYANILTPLSPIIAKLLDRVAGMGLDIRVIASDHGPIWREDIGRMPGMYAEWTKLAPTMKAVVVHDTMWGSTAKMATAIAEGLAAGGATPVVMPLHESHRSDVATQILEAGALVVGSPTINNQLFPSVAGCMCYLEGLKRKNMIGAAFGSYGWSGEAPKKLAEIFDRMKIEPVTEPLRVRFVPDDEALIQCRGLGEAVAARLAEICKE